MHFCFLWYSLFMSKLNLVDRLWHFIANDWSAPTCDLFLLYSKCKSTMLKASSVWFFNALGLYFCKKVEMMLKMKLLLLYVVLHGSYIKLRHPVVTWLHREIAREYGCGEKKSAINTLWPTFTCLYHKDQTTNEHINLNTYLI